MAKWVVSTGIELREIDFSANPITLTNLPNPQSRTAVNFNDIAFGGEYWLVYQGSVLRVLNPLDVSISTGRYGDIGTGPFETMAYYNGRWYGVAQKADRTLSLVSFELVVGGTSSAVRNRTVIGDFPAAFRRAQIAINSSGQAYIINSNRRDIHSFSLSNPASTSRLGPLPTAFDGFPSAAAFGDSPERLLVSEGITASHRNRIWEINPTSASSAAAPIWTETDSTSATINGIGYGPTTLPPANLSIEFESGEPEFDVEGLASFSKTVDLSVEFESGEPEIDVDGLRAVTPANLSVEFESGEPEIDVEGLESIDPISNLSVEFESGEPEFEVGRLRSVRVGTWYVYSQSSLVNNQRTGKLLITDIDNRDVSYEVVDLQIPAGYVIVQVRYGGGRLLAHLYEIPQGQIINDGIYEINISTGQLTELARVPETFYGPRRNRRLAFRVVDFDYDAEGERWIATILRRESRDDPNGDRVLVDLGRSVQFPNNELLNLTNAGLPSAIGIGDGYWFLGSRSRLVRLDPTDFTNMDPPFGPRAQSPSSDVIEEADGSWFAFSFVRNPVPHIVEFNPDTGEAIRLRGVSSQPLPTYKALEPLRKTWDYWPHSGPTPQTTIGDLDRSATYEIQTRKIFDGRQPSAWSESGEMETD